MIESLDFFHFEEDGHKYVQNGRNHPSVTGLLKKHGLIDYSMVDPVVLERKRELGLALHAWTERYDRDGDDDMLVLPEHAIGYAEGWQKFRRQSDFELIEIEHRLMSSILGLVVGGTPDRRMRRKRTQDVVLDLKFCTYHMPAWKVQTAGYELMRYNRTHLDNTVKRCSCQLFPEGRFQVHWYEDQSDGDAFMSMISLEAWKANNNLTKGNFNGNA